MSLQWILSYSAAAALKIRLRLTKSNQFFVMVQLYIHKNLVRIQLLVHKIVAPDANAYTNGIHTKNNMSLSA